jgi:hypothetical protein
MWRLAIFGIGLLVFLSLMLRPIALIQGINQEYSDGKILIEYEIFGCGSLVIKVLQGGEHMANMLSANYPDIATNEVRFTMDSDEPYLHLNSAEFWTAGLARGYKYIMEGEVVGTAKGALSCCAENENDVAYNAVVPEFRVDRWYVTNYMPYYMYGNPFIIFTFAGGTVFCSVMTVVEIKKRRRN